MEDELLWLPSRGPEDEEEAPEEPHRGRMMAVVVACRTEAALGERRNTERESAGESQRSWEVQKLLLACSVFVRASCAMVESKTQ